MRFIAYADEKLKDIEFTITYKVDCIYNESTIKPKDVIEIGGMKELWGQNMDEPIIVIENINITKDMLHLMARNTNPTLKISLSNGISLIKFKSSDEELDSLYSESGCITITIVGKCERNVWLDNVSPQIIIDDYEIVSRQGYYF